MSQNKTGVRKSEIDRRIKDRIIEKSNITFALPKDLLKDFKKSVESNKAVDGLTMNRVIEELIRSYLGK
jgi:hypothetical protein